MLIIDLERDTDAGKDWRQKQKRVTEMVGWHQGLSEREFEQVGEWRTGKPDMLESMRSQTVRHDLVTEQQHVFYMSEHKQITDKERFFYPNFQYISEE